MELIWNRSTSSRQACFLLVLVFFGAALDLVVSVSAKGEGHLTKGEGHHVKGEGHLIKACQQHGSCSCTSPDLGRIDLTPLAREDGSPMFENIESGIQQYSWNPCLPFTQDQCVDVAMCQRLTFPSAGSYPLGDQDSAKFVINYKGLHLSYSSNSWGQSGNMSATFLRTAYIKLVCDLKEEPGTFVADGEDKDHPGNYYFTLTSFHACPSKLKPTSGDSISPGSCLLIVCAVVVMVYLSFGIALQMFAFKRTGTDVIPNKTLWLAIPGLIKEGFQFTMRRGKTPGYEEV